MMKPAEKRPHGDLTEPLDRSAGRRILAQRQMRSKRVVITRVARKDSAQVGLAEDDDVIEAFPADRADQSLRMPVLPRRPRGDRVIAYAHGCSAPGDGMTIAPTPLGLGSGSLRYFIPREGIVI